MARESIGTAEFERLVARTGNEDYLARPYAGRRDDMTPSECVMMAAANDCSVMTASGTMTGRSPVIVRMAICRAINGLAVRNRTVKAVSLFLNVPAGMPEAEIRPFMREAYAVTPLSDVEIIRTGTDSVTAYAAAYGEPSAESSEAKASEAARNNQEPKTFTEYPPDAECRIVMCGTAGAEETVLLYEENRDRLKNRYPEHFLKDIPLLADGLNAAEYCGIAWEHGALYQYACGDGGVYSGLFGMSERLRTGLSVCLPSIPISQKTIEICEELDTDPYLIGAGGCILMITKHAEELLKALWEAGAEAADIGRLCEGHAKELRNGEEVRFLEPLRTKKNVNQ
ncbi:MAG: hypothetical protein J5643_10740 [Lachnospiraceae bacterium]|nr:hypothetical protein [Lachnospiraceae bacterium]